MVRSCARIGRERFHRTIVFTISQSNGMMRSTLQSTCIVAILLAGCVRSSPPVAGNPPAVRTAPDRTDTQRRVDEPASSPAIPQDATLADYLRYAEAHHPALQAARYRWEAATNAVPQARALPDPNLNLGYESMDRETRIGVSQMIPFPGKLDLRGQVAESSARVARQRIEAERRQILLQVAEAWAEYAYLGQTIAITRRNLDLVRQLEQLAAVRVRAGAPPADLLRAQIELGRIEDELRTVEDLMHPTGARLNAALGRRGDAELPAPEPQDLAPPLPREQQLVTLLHQMNPELEALRLEAEQAARSVQSARREAYPDFMIGADYMREPDRDGVGVMLSISLPVWRDRYRAAVRQATNQFNAAEAELVSRRQALEAELQVALYNLRDANRKIALYRDTLLPRADESRRASEAAYRAGTVDFLTLIEAYRLPLEFELALIRAQIQHAQRTAQIEALLGRPAEQIPPAQTETEQ